MRAICYEWTVLIYVCDFVHLTVTCYASIYTILHSYLMYVYLRFQGTSTAQVIGAHMNDNDGQMIFGDLGGPKLPDICLTSEEKPHPGNLSRLGMEPGPAA